MPTFQKTINTPITILKTRNVVLKQTGLSLEDYVNAQIKNILLQEYFERREKAAIDAAELAKVQFEAPPVVEPPPTPLLIKQIKKKSARHK
jgi:hypothetical protein